MAEFSKLVITRTGQALLAKMLAGQGDIKFSKISASSTFYEVEQLETLEELSDVKQTNKISKITRTNEVAVKVETAFSNTELIEGYYMRTLGLYAFDTNGEEILYAVTTETTGNCYMPAYNGVTVSGAYVQLVTTVGNAENVSIKIDQAAIATIGNIQELQGQIDGLQGKLNEYFGNSDGSDSGIEFVEGIEAKNVVDAINEVFQSGNKKKNKLVENLVAMGVPASTEETWEELLDKVLDMTDTSKDTVTENVLLDGYTAHDAAGELVTGTMQEYAGVAIDTTGVTQDNSYTYFGVPEGHYDESSKVRAINSDLIGKIYDAFVAAGTTPNDKTIDALVAAVTTLKNSAGISSVSSPMSISDRWTVTSKMAVVTANAFYHAWMNADNQGSGSAYCYLGTTGGTVRAQDSVWVGTHDGGDLGGGTYSLRLNKSAVFYKGEQVTVWGGSSRGYDGIRWAQKSLSMSAILLN